MPTDTLVPPPVDHGAESPESVAERILESEPILSEREIGYYLRALVQARFRIVFFTVGCMIASVLLALALPAYYTSRVVLLPTEDGDGGVPGQLGAIASTFGFSMPFGSSSQSDLYPVMLTSDRLLAEILRERFRENPDGDRTRLLDILVPDYDTKHEQEMLGLQAMRQDVIRAQKDVETGVVSLQVTTKSPQMSADVANGLTSLLEKYLVESRQQQGGTNRTFLDDRQKVVGIELAVAEETLRKFRETNRQMSNSPELELREDRLRREVLIQEQIFLEITRQKEIAEIEEVKNTPVLRVLDDARAPILPSKPHRTLFVILGCMLGSFAVVSWVLIRAAFRLSPGLTSALRPLRRDLGVVRRFSLRKTISSSS